MLICLLDDRSFNLYVRGNARSRSPLLGGIFESLVRFLRIRILLSDSNKISRTGKVTMQLYVYEWANLSEWVLTWKEGKRTC